MKQSKRKKRREQPSKQQNISISGNTKKINAESEEEKIIVSLMEAFSLTSVEEAEAAYKEANGDPNKAAEILCSLSESSEVFQDRCSNSSISFGLDSNSNSSEGLPEPSSSSDSNRTRSSRGSRGKKMVATTGTVSTVLGKDYVTSSSRKDLVKEKGLGGARPNMEAAEQFLCSMLGDDCELNMGVIRDVLCNCGFDVEKALEVLLDLSAPYCESSGSDKYSSSSSSSAEYSRNLDCIDGFWQQTDRGSDSNSYSSEGDFQDNLRLLDFNGRSYAEALACSDHSSNPAAASSRSDGPELPRQVLESLFHILKNSEQDPSTMNWRNVAKQMESFAQKRVQLGPSSFIARELNTQAKGAEYLVFRETARQEWDKMKTCYQKAAAAYSNGEKNYASYMSEQGKLCSKMAREADEKASMQIFKARNKGIENVLTIDLHGQHVKPAMRLVKLHLLFGTYISSVQYIRIITGCGSSGLGKSMLKQSVVNLLKNEGIEWKEENQGTVLIRLDGPREFSFLDSGNDSESD
ncbi:SMR domain-containing protein At5g58720-like [Chenopodium quinoa]|uniref:SMR domain-containing protein At5g58720-like n=1 Tax=Chenopodium quinoa TaxID=63459 RepID=UPI000B78A461|nr:SMR domain-containing protein At5g58720-like [Chenopodium quinoa]